ncbi:unnamed protein product [Adineta steineri]|uniref:Uncharacterized protein n=1 Tax=Adineta steineri TaxID=433720 RepID=A0A819A5L8_9BILA|nr:unnamed protein product [Adineta steineri]CAF0938707.1 unnamed protein product [Adineta steineri]CAF3780102.1 unnamed protein product [Adineta steineri]CAF3868944.1 unnamed protein product [Adineta steineri]
MPTNTKFCSKWLQNPDNTGKVNSRWLRQGKTTSSFQCMKDVFDSISLTASNNQSLLLPRNKNDNSTCIGTGSIDRNTTRILFVIVEKEQRALTHDDTELLMNAANAKLSVLNAQLRENSEN